LELAGLYRLKGFNLMNILFIGGMLPKEKEPEILAKSKSAIQYAANDFQWNLIDGFSMIDNVNLDLLSAPFIGPYPLEYTALFIKGFSSRYNLKLTADYVGFCNLWGVRNISRKNALTRRVKSLIHGNGSQKVIMIYSPHTPFLQAAICAKKIDPTIHICLIMPDLPEYMNLHQKKSILYKIFKKIDINIFYRHLAQVDSYVLISKHMSQYLRIGNHPYIVIEGMTNQTEPIIPENDFADTEEEQKIILYSGTLNTKFGIVNLLKAFSTINNPDYILNICGRGDAESIVTEYASQDSRIHYFGQVTINESRSMQAASSILINPRNDQDEYTKYSFPSKIIEYLLSGKPLIAYKLPGIPDEYDEYIFYIEGDDIQSMQNKIEEVLRLPYTTRKRFGEKARNFVIKNKNNQTSCAKIYNMIWRAINPENIND
jgi:glycosyltransferase involved in cell wall biosynthesis